jgi:hypothetical protein
MTLGQYACAVGAPARWVQNARASLGLRAPYDIATALRLGLAYELTRANGPSLREAYQIAKVGLERPDLQFNAVEISASARLVIDAQRYRSAFYTRLSLALSTTLGRQRGKRAEKRGSPAARARRHGVDLTLLEESLLMTPGDRLRRLEEASEFLSSARVTSR